MQQEKELLHGQITWLNKELKAKSEELLLLSRQKGIEILELKCSLDNKDDEVGSYYFTSTKDQSTWLNCGSDVGMLVS